MAVKAGTAYVDFEGDFSTLNRQVASHFSKISKRASGQGKAIGRSLGIGMAAGIGATVVAGKQLFDFGKDAVNVASDVNESLSKNQVLFGKYAKGIEGFSKRSADALGISRKSALEYTGTFGNLFKALGITDKESAKYSKSLLKLSADMASFNNSTPEEALEAIRSGLVGETEPLRRFGVNMNDATLKAQALKMGLIKTTKEALTPQQKALAANALIVKQTAKAHGDFNKTSDQLANSQRRLKARWEDTKSTLGTALLPAVTRVSGALLDIADTVQPKVERAVGAISRIFGRKDLNFGEKIQRSWNSIKFQFGPLADKLKDGIDDAKVGDKFKTTIEDAAPLIAEGVRTVGLKSAEYWWAGFKAAPLWAKVATGGWLATKLGLTGPALKGLFNLLTGKGGGLLSKATPMPVFVVNGGGLPGLPGGKGTPGAPIPVPGGKPPGGGGAWNWIKNIVGKVPKGVRWVGGGIALPITGYLTLRELVNRERGGNELPKLVRDLDDLVSANTKGRPREEQLKNILRQLDEATLAKDAEAVRQSGKALDKWVEANPNDSRIDQIKELAGEIVASADTIKNNKTPVDNFTSSIDKNALGIRRWRDDISSARGKLRGLKKGSEEYESRLRTLRRVQGGMNNELIDMLPVTEDAKNAVKDLGINFSNLGGDVNTTASYIAAATNMVLSGLGADTIKFSLKMSKRYKDYGGTFSKQRGGYIDIGAPSGDSVHAMLERDEYVLNRKAVRKVGRANLDRLNFGEAPRFQTGGIVELLHPFNDPAGHGGKNSHLHIAMSTIAGIIALGKRLQRLGWLVGENPAFGGIQGTHAAGGYHPQGLAIDANWPNAAEEGAKIKALLPSLGGNLATLLVAPKIPKVGIEGPQGMLRHILDSAEAKMRGEAQAYVDEKGPIEGAEPGSSLSASGNGADLMKQISSQRRWNFADWWEIDRRETGHGTNLVNPTSSARLRGQFLSNNWGRYGPGSDPAQNPSMAQQIHAMAAYIADRYGNPTKARQFHDANNYYRLGGLVRSLLQVGGAVASKAKGAKIPPNKWFEKLKHHKQHKPRDHTTRRMLDKLGDAGLPGEAILGIMQQLEKDVLTYADWAQRANDITNTDALQAALNAEMTLRGGRSNMSDTELLKLFPVADQDAFIQQWLHNNASINGGIQVDWLTEELSGLLAWRNTLIDNPPIFKSLIDTAQKNYDKAKYELKLIAADINRYVELRRKAVEKRRKHRDNIKNLTRDVKDELRKKPSAKRTKAINALERKIARNTRGEADAQNDINRYDAKLQLLKKVRSRVRGEAYELGGDYGDSGDKGDGSTGRISRFTEAKSAMEASLIDVHGLGSTMEKFISPSQFQLGALGGTILGVQNEILGIARNPPRASAEMAGPEDAATAGEEETKEILAELLRQANLRTAVSEAQFDVFRNLPLTFGNFPFGGSFAEGGPVPGPVGAPRMILAHGGEYVVPNDGGFGPTVVVSVASGMEWLKQFIDVRVESQTRAQGRRGERQLPGRAGLLTR